MISRFGLCVDAVAWARVGRDSGDADVHGLSAGAPVDLGELVVGAGEADLESFDLAEPAFAFGFGDAGSEVVADFSDAGPLGGVGPEHGAADAGVLVNARGRERPAAVTDGQLAPFEVSLHLSTVGGARLVNGVANGLGMPVERPSHLVAGVCGAGADFGAPGGTGLVVCMEQSHRDVLLAGVGQDEARFDIEIASVVVDADQQRVGVAVLLDLRADEAVFIEQEVQSPDRFCGKGLDPYVHSLIIQCGAVAAMGSAGGAGSAQLMTIR